MPNASDLAEVLFMLCLRSMCLIVAQSSDPEG